jgi:hypothetical protein
MGSVLALLLGLHRKKPKAGMQSRSLCSVHRSSLAQAQMINLTHFKRHGAATEKSISETCGFCFHEGEIEK